MVKTDTNKWYSLQVTANQEKKIKETIEKMLKVENMESYVDEIMVPVQKYVTKSNITGKKSIREKTIMPGYLLVKGYIHHDVMKVIESTPGVFSFLSTKIDKTTKIPIPMKDREMARFLDKPEGEDELIEFVEKYYLDEAVKITDGPFKDFNGSISVLDESKNKMTVNVLVFGRETPVELDYSQVEKVRV